jgi:hypothetical protein
MQYPAASCSPPVLGPNISLRTPLSKILSLNSSLHVRDQVSHSYKVTGKIIYSSLQEVYINRQMEIFKLKQ